MSAKRVPNKSEIERLIDKRIKRAYAEISGILGASSNNVRAATTTAGLLPTGTTAGGGLLTFAVAALQAQSSGVFMGGISVNTGASTAGDTVEFEMNTLTAAAGTMTLTNGVQAGAAPAAAAYGSTLGGVFTNHGTAAGITVNAAAGTLLRANTGVRIIDATDLGFEWNWVGIFDAQMASGAVRTPFALGNQVLMQATLGAVTHTPTFLDFTMWMIELPAA